MMPAIVSRLPTLTMCSLFPWRKRSRWYELGAVSSATDTAVERNATTKTSRWNTVVFGQPFAKGTARRNASRTVTPGSTTRSSFSSSISSRSARSFGVSSWSRSSSTPREATVSPGLPPAFMPLRSASSMLALMSFVPGLSRRVLLAVLATLAPAVAASPAGGAGHAAPNVGIVDIYTTLGYQHGAAAGTGMIVTRSGQVLTNNHVIAGATKYKVVDVTTHRTYSATVAGYSVSRDVALLQLAHA